MAIDGDADWVVKREEVVRGRRASNQAAASNCIEEDRRTNPKIYKELRNGSSHEMSAGVVLTVKNFVCRRRT